MFLVFIKINLFTINDNNDNNNDGMPIWKTTQI